MGGHNLLKKPLENLKDAIDWILWFWAYGRTTPRETNNYTKLANALNTLPELKDAREKALGQNMDPQGVIKKLAQDRLRDFLGHMSQGGGFDFTGSGIIQLGKGYTSKYPAATWNGSDDAKDVARIFLGATAITF
ncbi:proteasomal ubiquitin receptor ADRM1 [Babesia caballi]|uniref:Proteasomal ubiquitin receptor ADRM1 n=1 Tax=Babesia caballi TaxID=5871 RepID=A0AAV4LWV6_BABCB|nr:proteasomal ubiquitin receptor ADRM1 [Babesia caballi]